MSRGTLATFTLVGPWTYDERDAELLVLTDVTGPASRLGHALTLRWTRWQAEVSHRDGTPSEVQVVVDVRSLEVVHGEGGLKGLSPVEKAMVGRRALKELDAATHPQIEFRSTSVSPTAGGWQLTGILRVRGRSRPCAVRVREADGRLTVDEPVRQTSFGVTPVRFLGGAFSVADEVRVRLAGVAAPGAG